MTLSDVSPLDMALLALLALVAVGLTSLVAGLFRRRPATVPRAAAPDPEKLAALRKEAERLALRGRIGAITEDEAVPGLRMAALGEVWVVRDGDGDARDALAYKAARLFPDARALTRLTATQRNGRTEWRATACGPTVTWSKVNPKQVLVDGSNVTMWEQNAGLASKPSLGPLVGVIDCLLAEGRAPLVIFDASIGHRLFGRYLPAHRLEELIRRKGITVEVVDKGEIADRHLIARARETGAEIVTNDLFRDHARPAHVRLRSGFSISGQVELMPPP